MYNFKSIFFIMVYVITMGYPQVSVCSNVQKNSRHTSSDKSSVVTGQKSPRKHLDESVKNNKSCHPCVVCCKRGPRGSTGTTGATGTTGPQEVPGANGTTVQLVSERPA
jgi:hypothetical protein